MQIAEHVVEFKYEVIVEEDDLVFDEEKGRWRLRPEAREQAYEQAVEGFSDQSGDWYPRYAVLCQREYMAGQVCGLEKDHDGGHR